MEIEKECEICGTWFIAKRSNRKYCDECQKNSAKARAKLNRSVENLKQTTGYYDQYVPKYCSECKQYIKMVPRTMKHHIMYCGEDCKNKARERASRNRWTPTKSVPKTKCPCCKREFDNPGFKKIYCCNECRLKDRAREKVIGDVTLTCEVCGKQFVSHRNRPTYVNALPRTCSKECVRELCRRAGIKGYEISQSKTEGERKKRELEKLYNENGLCGYCKTPYKNCERMESNFRIIPEGARFNDKGKIIVCPKFTEVK